VYDGVPGTHQWYDARDLPVMRRYASVCPEVVLLSPISHTELEEPIATNIGHELCHPVGLSPLSVALQSRIPTPGTYDEHAPESCAWIKGTSSRKLPI
jgi:hypothetical protein